MLWYLAFARLPLLLASVKRHLRDAEVFHFYSASYWSFWLATAPAWFVAFAGGKWTVINYHSGDSELSRLKWRSVLPILRRTDCVVAPSGYLAGILHTYGIIATVIPNVFDLASFPFRLRESPKPALIFTRGFEASYRPDLAVRAFGEVQRNIPGATLVMTGVGSLEPATRRYVQARKLHDVCFAGKVPRDELSAYYERADIFLNSSDHDNFPIAILEAFASGTPVVSTAPEGIPFMVEHERTGLLSEPGDWKGLSSNLMRVLQEPGLGRKLARNAREELNKYRWEAVHGQWLNLYHSLMAKGSVRRPGS